MARRNSPQADAPLVEQRGVEGVQINGAELRDHDSGRFHVSRASADGLLSRLDGVVKSGPGWRAKCPACGGRDRPLSITEADDRVLLNCFKCHDADAVLAAVSLSWSDLHPPRHWPHSPEEREYESRVFREVGIVSAIEVLALEGAVIEAAGRQLQQGWPLNAEDDARLNVAVERVSKSRRVLSRQRIWRAAA